MHEAKINFRVIVKARRDAAEVLEPCIQPLDLPAATVASQNSTVLRWRSHAIRLVRRDHLKGFCGKLPVERAGVIGDRAYEPSRSLKSETRLQSVSDKGDFRRRSTCPVEGDRKTMKVCHRHEFRAFAPLSRTNSVPPFFRHDERAVDKAFREVEVAAST